MKKTDEAKKECYFRVERLVCDLDMTIEDLMDELDLNPRAWIHWKYGHNYPKTTNIIKMCRLFGCSADYLLLGKEDV